jgi:hypothetical protein
MQSALMARQTVAAETRARRRDELAQASHFSDGRTGVVMMRVITAQRRRFA